MKHIYTLETEATKLKEELSRLGRRNLETGEWEATPDEVDESDADENTQADRFEDFEERSSLMKELSARLTQVEAALKKAHEGGYGICATCGNPIEENRLEANPAADTCIEHMQ
jgi:DnaK suppressor protein